LGVFFKNFEKLKKILDFLFFDFYEIFLYGEYESERFEPFPTDFDRVSGVLPPLEGEGTQIEWYPQIQSTVENYLLGLYPPKHQSIVPHIFLYRLIFKLNENTLWFPRKT